MLNTYNNTYSFCILLYLYAGEFVDSVDPTATCFVPSSTPKGDSRSDAQTPASQLQVSPSLFSRN